MNALVGERSVPLEILPKNRAVRNVRQPTDSRLPVSARSVATARSKTGRKLALMTVEEALTVMSANFLPVLDLAVATLRAETGSRLSVGCRTFRTARFFG